MQEDIYGNVDHYENPASDKNTLYAQLNACGVTKIKRHSIKSVVFVITILLLIEAIKTIESHIIMQEV